ncbi:hypothetical protein TNCV_3535711 [Trichonephila clavipes]|nr:hypothetical protein TNCV_3535711 [Trichonephila clavipes]
MYHAQFSNQRMLDHIIFPVLHRQLCETHSFHVTMHHAGRQRAVPSPSLEESILNILADRFESSTRAVAYHFIFRGIGEFRRLQKSHMKCIYTKKKIKQRNRTI